MNKKPELTIVIPAYNNEKTIRYSIDSAISQEFNNKEIIVVDDCSDDNTLMIAWEYLNYGVIVYKNDVNLGIGENLKECIKKARGKYILFLCADDIFTNNKVASDVVRIFKSNNNIGVVNRWYYQFIDGIDGAVCAVRNDNLFISACNPSGMAIKKIPVKTDNTIFIEMPQIIADVLRKGYEWTTLEYDTVAVRIHPGGNTGTKEHYYTDSPVKVWSDFLGKDFKYHEGLIQIKNWAPKLLWREIWMTVKLNKKNLIDLKFWMCALIALAVPRFILIRLSSVYRNRIGRLFVNVIERPTQWK